MLPILIVDSQDTAAVNLLQQNSVPAVHLKNVNSACEWLQKNECSLIISETAFNDHTGFYLVRFLRRTLGDKLTPFMFVSDKRAVKWRVHGLRSGANDYLCKPYNHEELLARIKAHLRVAKLLKNPPVKKNEIDETFSALPPYTFGEFTVNYQQFSLTLNGKPVSLTHQEFRLLAYLIAHKDVAVKKDELLDRLWQYDISVGLRTIYTHLSWLREKLKCETKPEGYIKTVRQVGYMFTEEPF